MRPAAIPEGTASVVERLLTPEPERELPRDPVVFMRDDLGEHPWSMQRKIARSVVENRYTAVPSAHGTGKSYVAARIAAWWIAGHPPGEAFVVTSAPTDDQVHGILWREIGRAHRAGGLPGRITLDSHWYVGPRGAEELVGWGRKPADLKDKTQAMQSFQGIHARYLLVVLDEATGIPPWLWDAVDTLVTAPTNRVLAIGNPDDATARFAEVCKPGSGWSVMPVSAFDLPWATGERVPEHVAEVLTSRAWVEERLARWGADNPLYQSKVLAQFPESSDDKVITPAMVKRARALDLPGLEPGAYGLDVARYGEDQTVLYRDRGGVLREVDAWRKMGTAETRKRVMALTQPRTPSVPIVVDADGIGGGVYDELIEAGVRAVPFTVNTPARNKRRYYDRRSEMWWAFRGEMEDGLIDLDPADDELAAQLQSPKWWLDSRGRIRVESKDDLRERGVSSPDRADACIMARFGAPPPGLPGGYPSPTTIVKPPRPQRSQTADLLKRPM